MLKFPLLERRPKFEGYGSMETFNYGNDEESQHMEHYDAYEEEQQGLDGGISNENGSFDSAEECIDR